MNLHSHLHIVCDPKSANRLDVKESHELKTPSAFVKAASGVAVLEESLYIVQDSSRKIAQVGNRGRGEIEFFALAPTRIIAELEDETQPYELYRKERKADFEAITTLHDGRLLILGSGYDAHKICAHKPHYKNMAVIFDPKTKKYEEISLASLYSYLLSRQDFVGSPHKGIDPRLNIEGVASLGSEIALFHRANYNKNRHDSAIFFDTRKWLSAIGKSETWWIKETRLVTFDFGAVEFNGTQFPITLNDAAFWNEELIIPVAAETDSIVDGKDVDGEVIWMGLARINLTTKECSMYQFDESKMAKVEGIAPDPSKPGDFFMVHDVDSEDKPSRFSRLSLSNRDEL